MSLSTYVIRHVAFEDLGLWHEPIAARSSVRYLQAGIDDLTRCMTESPDLLVVLGGPIGAYQSDKYPFLTNELEVIRHRLDRRLPLLGICLGAQLIAAAAGARVFPSGVKEIGWGAISLTDMGNASCLRPLAGSCSPVLHWHGDTFDLPDGAQLLASTKLAKHQAFSIGHAVLALQFHAEVDPKSIEAWLIGHACELDWSEIEPAELRAQTLQLPSSLPVSSELVIETWLKQIGW